MPEARTVAERALGHPLPKGAEVHHVNGRPRDNRPQNLVICQNRAYHLFLHERMRARGYQTPSDVCSFTLRGVDNEFWRRVKIHAAMNDTTVRALILSVLRKAVRSSKRRQKSPSEHPGPF